MAHFAKVLSGKVLQVIVAEPEFFERFVDTSPGTWLQCSYNTRGGVHYGADGQPDGGNALRKNFPGVGWNHDVEADAFFEPQPFPSWTLNRETFLWDSPVPHPGGDQYWTWDESALTWVSA